MFPRNHREVERQNRIKIAGTLCLALIDEFEREQERKRKLAQSTVDATQEKKASKKFRKMWVREWLSRRPDYGQYDQLLTELHREDARGYKNFLRITPDLFHEMVERLTPLLEKQATFMRQPLEVGLKLATTLRFLATGDSYASLQYSFRVQHSTISKFIPEVCRAIYEVYKPEVLVCPKSAEEWNQVAEGFRSRWNYHNCLGALDGKHIAMKKPPSGGSFYFNYKHFHSIVLMALVDSGYKFLYLDVGAEGGASDGGIWNNCTLYQAVEDGRANLPTPVPLPKDDTPIPYHFVADDAFALKTWLMKPFSHRSQVKRELAFSYRLSRARRVVENAFGLLCQRFLCFSTTLQQKPETINHITLCACVLHNLVLQRYPLALNEMDCENAVTHDMRPGAWRENVQLPSLISMQGRNYTKEAKDQRDYLSHYYSSPDGSVPWQDKMVFPEQKL